MLILYICHSTVLPVPSPLPQRVFLYSRLPPLKVSGGAAEEWFEIFASCWVWPRPLLQDISASVSIASTLVVCSWTRQRQHYLPSSHQTHTTHGHTETFTGVCGCCWYQYSLIKTAYYCRIGFHLQHGQIWRNLQKRWSSHTIVLWQHLHADVGCVQPKDVNT